TSLTLVAQPNATDPSKPSLSKKQQEKLKERDRLSAEAQKLRAAGKLAEAIAVAEKMLALEREVLGELHEDVVGSVELLGKVHEQREDFAAARQPRQEVLAIRTKLQGGQHWRVTDALPAVAHVDRLAQLAPEQRRQLVEAQQLNAKVIVLYREGKYA